MQFKKRNNKISADVVESKPFMGSEKMAPKPFMGSEKPMIKDMEGSKKVSGDIGVKASLASLRKKSDMPTIKTTTAMEMEEEGEKSESSDAYKDRIKKRMK